jgi:hypothetical protein
MCKVGESAWFGMGSARVCKQGPKLTGQGKTFPGKGVNTEISPLRFAPVEMTILLEDEIPFSRKGPRNCRSLHGKPGLVGCARDDKGEGVASMKSLASLARERLLNCSQSSLRDWTCWDEYPALRAGLSSAVPSGLSSIQPHGWALLKKCYSNSAEFIQLGILCIALAQEEIEVAALVGLQYGILK